MLKDAHFLLNSVFWLLNSGCASTIVERTLHDKARDKDVDILNPVPLPPAQAALPDQEVRPAGAAALVAAEIDAAADARFPVQIHIASCEPGTIADIAARRT